MSSLIKQKKTSLSGLKNNRASKIKQRSNEVSKKARSNERLRKAKSGVTIRTKQREVQSAETKIAKYDKEISILEGKISGLEKDISEKEVKRNKKTEKDAQKTLEKLDGDIDRQKQIQLNHEKQITELKRLPKQITVLFMASNPEDQDPLRLDQEARGIEKEIKLSKKRENVNFKTQWAVRAEDILQAINEYNPEVIHFSGHGNEEGLALEKSDGTLHFVKVNALVQAIQTTSDNVKLMFFNTCNSYTQADAVTEYIDVAIGMSDAISDEAAKLFSTQFYSSLGFGLSVKKSFEQAKARLMLENVEGELIPRLYEKERVDADKLIIVDP